MSVSCLLVPLYIINNILRGFKFIVNSCFDEIMMNNCPHKGNEKRNNEKIKNEAIKEELRLKRLQVKAAKDLTKANAAINTADLIIPKPEFMVGSHVKTIVNTLPGVNSNESELVEGNVIYK